MIIVTSHHNSSMAAVHGNFPAAAMMTPGWEIPVDISKCHSEDFVDCISNYIIWGWVKTLLISILMGWTSIYQLFWGSLGARVLTNSHIIFQYIPWILMVSLWVCWFFGHRKTGRKMMNIQTHGFARFEKKTFCVSYFVVLVEHLSWFRIMSIYHDSESWAFIMIQNHDTCSWLLLHIWNSCWLTTAMIKTE